MNIHFLSFATSPFSNSLKRIKKEATDSGFYDSVTCLTHKDLPLLYRLKNFSTFNRFTPGYGYWKWKSFIVKEALSKLNTGDVLMYADAGCSINKEGKQRFDEYINMLLSSPYSNLSFHTYHQEKQYTKADLFHFFNLENDEAIKNSFMLMATTFLIVKDEASEKLVDDWYAICHNHQHLIDNTASVRPNDDRFKAHRHDQSIFSLLRKLRGTFTLADETYFDDWEVNKKFPVHARRQK